ncbi:MAG TPA: sialate O-acetylesterase, partial [Puia sp.]
MHKYLLCFFQLLFLFTGRVHSSGLYIPAIYSDNMMIQADTPSTISGSATPFQSVSLRIEARVIQATAEKDGSWTILLPAFRAGYAFDMEITAGDEKRMIRNVIAGDVWLCSGQSNMEMNAGRTDVKDAIHTIPAGIRYFVDQSPPSPTPSDKLNGHWVVCSPENAAGCSAVALSFALHLIPRLGRPVGLVINAKGGTPIESWTDLYTLQNKEYDQTIFQRREQWKKDREKYELQYQHSIDSAKAKKIFPPFQIRENWNPASLYNSLVYPIRRLAFKGVIWYQGESNADLPFIYRYQLADMIHSWRSLFQQPHLPFFIIQLPEYRNTDDWAVMRESQASVGLDNVWPVVSLGLGDTTNIHPVRKIELGRRVALQVLAKAYHYNLTSSGPLFQTMKREGKKMILTFDCGAGSLVSSDGQPIRNVEIAGSDPGFLPATTRIVG